MKKIFIILIFSLLVSNADEQSHKDGFKAGYEDGSKDSEGKRNILKNISDFNNAKKGVDRAMATGAFRANFDFLCILPAKILYSTNIVDIDYVNGCTKGCEKAIFKNNQPK